MDDFAVITDRLAEAGIDVTIDKVTPAGTQLSVLEATLRRRQSEGTYYILHGPVVTLTDITRIGRPVGIPLMVWASTIQTRTGDAFRRAGIQYADAAGNAWLEFGDVLIDVRGRRSPREEHAHPNDARAANLFSASRVKVIFALLNWPSLWAATTRELADVADVSVGLAHGTLNLLAHSGYGKHSRRARDRGLLDPWAAAYATSLAPQLTLASYRGDVAEQIHTPEESLLLVSGERAATDLIRPSTVTAYVDDLDPRLPVVNRWRADGTPNIIVRRKFWRSPGGVDAQRRGVQVAPWPLVYADLIGSDDPRLQNTATEWRDRHLDDVAAPD